MELRDYIRILRTRKWIIIEVAVIVALSAYVFAYMQPKFYQGRAKIALTSADSSTAALMGMALYNNQPERSLSTQIELMRMRPLGEAVVRKLNLQMSPDALLGQVAIAPVADTDILLITVTDTSASRAADIANAVAEIYVQTSRDTKRESLKAAGDELQRRLDETRAELLTLARQVKASRKTDKNGNLIRDDFLETQLGMATGLYTTLADRLETIRVSEQLEAGPARVVSTAVVSPAPISRNPRRNALTGLVIGLVLGLGVAFLLEYLDNTIKTTDEAEKYYEAPVLGHIPAETSTKGERRLTIVDSPGSPAAEAYRVLRNSLDFINFEQDIKTMLIASSAPAEGKSTVAANLAMALAQTGLKVVLVNCDFRRPVTDQFFAVSNTIGLSDVLMGHNSLKAALQRPGDQELLVLTSGKMPPNPSELLGSEKMSDLVKSLGDWADWVIVDSPPLLAVSDASAFARWADGVLMVSRAGVSTRQSAKNGREMLDRVGARVLGIVIWGIEGGPGSGGYGYYHDSYYGAYKYHGYYTKGVGSKKTPDSGARGVPSASVSAGPAEIFVPQKSVGRRIADGTVRALGVVLGIVLVLAVVAVAAYLLDGYFGWGIAGAVNSVLR